MTISPIPTHWMALIEMFRNTKLSAILIIGAVLVIGDIMPIGLRSIALKNVRRGIYPTMPSTIATKNIGQL
jgi:hypothetical protein